MGLRQSIINALSGNVSDSKRIIEAPTAGGNISEPIENGYQDNIIMVSRKELEANYIPMPYQPYQQTIGIYPFPYDGEKSAYELGTPYEFYPDYYTLRLRAWEAYLKRDTVQNAIKKYCLWIVGEGLKLQSGPNEFILKRAGISQDEINNFIEEVESQFRLFCEMKQSVFSGENNLHAEAAEALKNAILAGDVLIIQRFDGKYPTTETIDGINIQTPVGTQWMADAEKKKNQIVNGVEINQKGSHIAYYIKKNSSFDPYSYERVEAYGKKTGRRQAWLMYGMKAKKSDVRGLTLLSAIMEKAAKIDRYIEATVGAAELGAKIPITIEHNQFSTGENPFLDQLSQSMGKNKGIDWQTISEDSEAKATKIAQITNQSTVNLPQGAKLNKLINNVDSQFKSFLEPNMNMIYSVIGIPPEVAQDKFGGAYSGSRAALKSWEHKMKVDRKNIMKDQFYKPIYDYWLDLAIMMGIVTAPGYMDALQSENYYIIESWRTSRFIGALVPHIDPVKEVSAMRMKLGKLFETVPLQTIEQVMEELNSGDFDNAMKKLSDEKKVISEFLIQQQSQQQNQSTNNSQNANAEFIELIKSVIEDIMEEKLSEITTGQ